MVDEEKLIMELRQIEKALSGPEKVYPYDFVQKGQKVFVKKGPLKGVEGIIIRKANNCRLVLSVESIMQSISVSVEADQVDLINRCLRWVCFKIVQRFPVKTQKERPTFLQRFAE